MSPCNRSHMCRVTEMFYLFVWCCCGSAFALDENPFQRVYNSIVNNSSIYDPLTPPWLFTGKPVNLFVTDYFTILIDVEENRRVVKLIANFDFTWDDPRLKWDPEEMGIAQITVPATTTLWRPSFVIYNALNTKDIEEQWGVTELQVNYRGLVSLIVYSYVEAVCPINVEAYPFDEQYCFLGFSPINAEINLLNITTNKSVLLTNGIPEWDIRETYAFTSNFSRTGSTFCTSQIVFHFKRNSQFYVFFLILPTFIVTSICIGAMLLPIQLELGERINVGIAGLLGLTFLLSVIIGEVPRTPSLPLMGKWVIMEMFFCFFSMLVPILIAVLDKCLIRYKKNIDVNILEGVTFLLVSMSNTITTILLFALPPKSLAPTQFLTI